MRRHRDDGRVRVAFADRVLVRCPRCAGRAESARPPGASERRLTCDNCALVRPTAGWHEADLWLRAACAGRTLWAYNLAHLDAIAAYVAAQLREDVIGHGGRGCGYSGSMAQTLPPWIKDRKHREDVLRTLDKLRQRADER